MSASPPKIDLLPEHLIDQIKAGEVIERPGNLIKEILENAVDAGAHRLELHVVNNGLDLISLKDSGHGMRKDDLPLAFSRHATSKIENFEDLYRLHSFGFRGEALASISAIAKVQCISQAEGEAASAEIRIEGGKTIFHGDRQKLPASGVELNIQDLFFNTPARLKFIQSQQSEKNFIRKVVFAFILSHPKIEFQIKFDDGEKEIFPRAQSLEERIVALMPKAKGQVLRNFRRYENIELEVHLVPATMKAPLKWQNIYINDRFILDKQFHRVLGNALLASFPNEDFFYLAHFRVPAEEIDVNVHPNKTIIKCMQGPKMISLLTSTIREMRASLSDSVSEGRSQSAAEPTEFDFSMNDSIGLQQSKQAYNMEGVFSPHNLKGRQDEEGEFIWLAPYYLYRQGQEWYAVHALKLLKKYIQKKIQGSFTTIPLLVSEPFSVKLNESRLQELGEQGLELDALGDTLFLRSIPDWLNGFPLREIVRFVLGEIDITEILLDPDDWSKSSWTEMYQEFSRAELMEDKVIVDLKDAIRARL